MTMQSLNDYTTSWTQKYQKKAKMLKLFQKGGISWDLEKKQKFVKTFYHIRGHFYKFLWTLGGFAPNNNFKKVILGNVEEELGGRGPAHEKLYLDFGQGFGVDILEEVLLEKYNFEFVKQFNQNHINFIVKEPWNSKWGAFSAYEKLDNVDYTNLLSLAKEMKTGSRSLIFFKVHQVADHFESTSKLLEEIWEKDPQSVKKGFEFIAQNQLEMWRELGKMF